MLFPVLVRFSFFSPVRGPQELSLFLDQWPTKSLSSFLGGHWSTNKCNSNRKKFGHWSIFLCFSLNIGWNISCFSLVGFSEQKRIWQSRSGKLDDWYKINFLVFTLVQKVHEKNKSVPNERTKFELSKSVGGSRDGFRCIVHKALPRFILNSTFQHWTQHQF